MSAMRFFPYRTIDPDDVTFHPWELFDDTETNPLPARLAGWDTNAGLALRCWVEVRVESALESTGLTDPSDLVIYAAAECPDTFYREMVSASCSNGEAWLDLRIAPGQVAERLTLRRGILLATSDADRPMRVAKVGGSKLTPAEDTTPVRLGDETESFPTRMVPFDKIGLPDVPWKLDVLSTAMESPFRSSIQLLVNSSHFASKLYVDKDPKVQTIARTSLRLDLVRQLFATFAAVDDEFPMAFDDDSVAYVLEAWASRFLGEDVPTALKLLQADPVEFEMRLQETVGYLKEVS